MKRKLWIVVASVAGVLLLGAAAAAIFIKPERIKNEALARLEAATGYTVTAGDASIKLGLGSVGIRVRDVAVASPDTSQSLFVNYVDILVKPVPLLRKRVELRHLVLNQPSYTVETRARQADRKSGSGGALAVFAAESWAIQDGAYRQRGPWGELILQNLDLGGGFVWTPEAGGKGEVQGTIGTGWVRALEGEWPLPAAETSVRFTMSPAADHLTLPAAAFRSGDLDVRLTADYTAQDGAWVGVLEGGAAPVGLETLKPWFPDSVRTLLDAWMVSGTVAIPSLRVEQTREGSLASGVIALDRVFVLPPGLPVGVENASGRIRFSPEGTVFEAVTGTLGPDVFTASGGIETGPPAEIRLKLATTVSAETLARAIPASAPLQLAAGRVAVDVEAAASPAAREMPRAWGTVSLAGLSGSWRGLPLREGAAAVRFEGRKAALSGGRVRVGRSDVAISGTVEDTRDPDMRFTLTSSLLDLNELFPEEKDPGKEPGGMVALPGTGSVAVETLVFRKLRATGLRSAMTLSREGLFFSDLRAALYNGTVRGGIAVRPVDDGSRWRYESDLRVDGVDALPLASGWDALGGFLEGKLSGDLSLHGIAGEADPLRTFSLAGEITVNDGALRNLPGLSEMAATLNLKGVSRDRWPFRSLGMRLAVEEGRVLLENAALRQAAMGWDLGGSIGFDGSLALKGTVRIDPRQITVPGQFSLLVPAMTDKDGRIPLDFLVGGSTLSPAPKVDWQSLGKRAQENVTEKAKENVKNALRKSPVDSLGKSLADSLRNANPLKKLKNPLKIGGG
jgi:hypothetical protein